MYINDIVIHVFFLFQVGAIYDIDCEKRCECKYGGKWKCEDVCQKPFVNRGQKTDDPSCIQKDYDECCIMLICSNQTVVSDDDPKIGKYID